MGGDAPREVGVRLRMLLNSLEEHRVDPLLGDLLGTLPQVVTFGEMRAAYHAAYEGQGQGLSEQQLLQHWRYLRPVNQAWAYEGTAIGNVGRSSGSLGHPARSGHASNKVHKK